MSGFGTHLRIEMTGHLAAAMRELVELRTRRSDGVEAAMLVAEATGRSAWHYVDADLDERIDELAAAVAVLRQGLGV